MLFNLRLLLTVTLALVVTAAPTETLPKANVVWSCKKSKTVALTFDDGPSKYIYNVSKMLVAAKAVGTFFFNGLNYGCIYDAEFAKRVLYAHQKGHQVASHTWSHLDLATLTLEQVVEEMKRTDDAISKITGLTPAFVRPPFGSYNDIVLQAAYQRGQTVAMWDFDSGDSMGLNSGAVKKRYDAAIAKKPKNILTLNHDTISSSAHTVLPHAIAKLQAAGYKLVSLADCLGVPAYTKVSTPTPRDNTWTCAAPTTLTETA